jgi:SNF2 family DNA or RNA helicase
MGLGKTVQMIATMVLHAPDVDAARRTTLIVLPAALMQQVRIPLNDSTATKLRTPNQWKDEIEEKTNGVLKAHIHHGNDKIKVRLCLHLSLL